MSWNSFQLKWDELGDQNYRLIDMETYLSGNQRYYIGVWEAGSYNYYLWSGVDWENFVSKWAENAQNDLRLIDIEHFESTCSPTSCLNNGLLPDNTSTPNRESYNYGIETSPTHCNTGPCPNPPTDTFVTYRWPNVVYGSTYYFRINLIYDAKDQIFRLPFSELAANMNRNGWLYSLGSWHHAIDYSKKGGGDFQVVAAAAGKVIHIGWDEWSGNTVVLSHNAGGETDVYRTIYMHLRDGADVDCASAWANTINSPDVSQANEDLYKTFLAATGCPQNVNLRNPVAAQWGTDAQTISVSINQQVVAGTILGWAGSTGPGGCGCMGGGVGPNTHLHIFFAHRDSTDDLWYLFDPSGIYGYPSCYPSAVNGALPTSCTRYPVSWKNGSPGYV
jgi:hypothetical protein